MNKGNAILFRLTVLVSALALFHLPSKAQVSITTSTPVVQSCLHSDTVRVVITNTSSSAIDSFRYKPEFPTDVTYVTGSAQNMSERDTSNLGKPVFAYTGSIASGDSVVVKYLVEGGCELNDQNKFPIIKHQVDRYVSSSSSSSSITDTLATFITPDLAIASSTVTGNAYTFVGDTIELKIKLTNNSFGDVQSILPELTVGSSLVALSSSLGTVSQTGTKVTITNDSVITSKTDLEFTVKFKVTSCSDLSTFLSLYWGCPNDRCNTETQNIGKLKTIPSSSLVMLARRRSNQYASGPFCDQDTMWSVFTNNTAEPYVTGSGSIYDLSVRFRNDRFNGYFSNGVVDSLIIVVGNKRYSVSQKDYTPYVHLTGIQSDPDGNGGLSDLDGDGSYDDLAAGDSILIGVLVKAQTPCPGLTGPRNTQDQMSINVSILGRDGCGNDNFSSNDGTTHLFSSLNYSSSGNNPKAFYTQTNIDTANPLDARYLFSQTFPRKCGPGAKVRNYFVFPGDVSVDNISVSGISNPYTSQFRGDTLVVDITSTCTDTTAFCTINNIDVRFRMNMNCNTTTRSYQIEYITTVQCDTSCNSCEFVTRRGFMPIVYFQPCESSNWCSGATLKEFDINRITLGYDSINPLQGRPASLAKTKIFIPYDTLLVKATGTLASTNWDSLRFHFETSPLVNPGFKFFQHAGAKLLVYDSAGNYKGSCDSFAVYDSIYASYNHYSWNLTKHGCSSYPNLKGGDSLVFLTYLLADSMPYYGGYANYLQLNRGYFSVDSGTSNSVCNFLGTDELRYHTNQMEFKIDNSISCSIFGEYNSNTANQLCTPNSVQLYGYMGHLLNSVPFSGEYRPFLKVNKLKYIPSNNVSVEDSFVTAVNLGLHTSHLYKDAWDTIYHTRSGDTLIYDLSDTSHLPFGYSSCYRNVFTFFLPISVNCHDGDGAYVDHLFLIDYDINLHSGDSSKIYKHRNFKVSAKDYLQVSNPVITQNINYVDATSDTSYWELRVKNNNTVESPYQTFFFTDTNSTVFDTKVIRVEVDGKSFYPTTVDSATLRVDLDTLGNLQDKLVRIYFTTTSCSLDEINVKFGVGCQPIKLSSFDNICIKEEFTLKVDPKPINPRISIIDEPSSSNLDLCQSMHYEVELTNSQAANGSDVKFYFLPPAGDGFSVLYDSSYFYYKNDTTTHYGLGAPTYDSAYDRYRWNLPSNHVLSGINSSISDFVFHMVLAPNCNFRQNDFVRFQASALAPCQDSLASNITTGQNIVLNNINNTVASHFSRSTINVVGDNLCDTFAIRYTWVNIGNDLGGSSGHTDPDTTTDADYMEIQLPSDLIESSIDLMPLTNNASGLIIDNQYTSNGVTYIKIPLPSGLDKTDSLAYELRFLPDHGSSCSDSFNTSIYNYYRFESYCTTLSDTCRLVKETGSETKTGIKLDQRWSFELEDLASNLLRDSTQDRTIATFKLHSKAPLNSSNPIYLNYYYDQNKSGGLDASDTLVNQKIYAQNLVNGDSISISDTLLIPSGWSCGLIVSISSDSNCICDDFDTLFPTPDIVNLSYSDSLCYSTNGTLNIGVKINGDYSYLWSGDTASFAFTDTLEQPTIQYKLDNPVKDTTYRFIREIFLSDNGCVDYDSVDVLLMRTPEVDLGPDIHRCVFDSFDIAIDPFNYSILWHDGSSDSFYRAYDDEQIRVTVSNFCGSASDTLDYFMEELDIFSLPFVTDSVQCRKGNFFIVGANITNQSTDTIVYDWDWKDGSITHVNPGSHSYSTPIDDTIKVVATNGWCTDSMTTHLKVVPNPTVDFDILTIDSCSASDSFAFNFTGSVDSSFVYTWYFGDGTSTISSDTVYKSYRDTGLFNIKLVVSLPGGCSDSLTQQVQVYPTPTAGFTIDDSLQCLKGNDFSFINTSTISSGSMIYNWDFGDGSSSSSLSPDKTYNNHGNYTVELIVISSFACADTAYDSLQVFQQPVAGFTITKSDSCLNSNSFDFVNTSSITSDSLLYNWNFGDANTGTDTSYLDYSYSNDGGYTVELIVSTLNNCRDTAVDSVRVYPNPVAGFTINDSLQCLKGNNFSFTNTSTISSGSIIYNWDFGDGSNSSSQSPNKTYSNHGNYTIQLITTSSFACSDTAHDSLQVFQQPIAGFTVTKSDSCLNSNSFDFVNTSSIASDSLLYDWSFGDANTGIDTSYLDYTYSNDGGYTIELIVSTLNNCRDTAVDSVRVYPNPVAGFTIGDSLQCLKGNDFTFTNTSTISSGSMTYNWDFGDGSNSSGQSPNKTYSNHGNYTIQLIVTSSFACTDTVHDSLQVFQQPIAGFTVTKTDSCLNSNSFDFVNTSSIASDSVLYNWNFGDTNTGTDTSYLDYTYSNDGGYTVELIVSTLNNCRDTAVDSVRVYPNPVAGFTINDSLQCLKGNDFTFTNTSTISSGSMTYNWDFGDGSNSYGQSPNKTYNNHGNYTIQLIATSAFTCVDTVYDSLQVFQQPIAGFMVTKSDSCLNSNSFDFVNTSSITSDSLLYDWNFGDANTGTDTFYLDYTYSNDGRYTVELIVSTLNNCRDTAVDSVRVYPNPVAGFTIDDSLQCLKGNDFTLTNASTISSGSMTYNWDFNDGSNSSNQSPNKTYNNHGNYTIELIATSGFACADTAYDSLQVFQQPLAGFTITKTDSCLNSNRFDFVNTSSIASDSLFFNWDFDDGNTGTDTNYFGYSFSVANNYNVKLKVSTSHGCKDSLTRSIEVYPMPVASVKVQDSVQCFKGNNFTFTNNSSVPSGTLSHYFDFGNSTTSSSATPNVSYGNTGMFNVTYIATTNHACRDTQLLDLVVLETPIPAFSIDSAEVCLPTNLFNFYNQSTIASGSSMSYNWTISNGYNSTTDSILNYKFSNAGMSDVKLVAIANNSLNCRDSVTEQVRVLAVPTADFNVPNPVQCLQGNSFNFTNTGTTPANFLYNFGDGNQSTTEHPSHSYTTIGTYTVELVTTLHGKCRDTISKNVQVGPVPEGDFKWTTSSQCFDDHSVDLALTGPLYGATSITWDLGDGNTASDSAITDKTFSIPGSYVVKVIVSSGLCSDSSTQTIDIYPNPEVAFEGDSVCLGDPINFVNNTSISSGTITGYNWQFGDGQTSTQTTPSYTYGSTGTFTVILTATSDKGCISTNTAQAARIHPTPVASMLATPVELSQSGQLMRYTSTSTDADDVVWYFDDNTSDFGASVEKIYPYSGHYALTMVASTSLGCSDSVRFDTTLTVPRFLFIPSSFSPNGDNINDAFGVDLRGTPLEYNMSIFNRWGEKIFESENPGEKWDGTYMGETVQNGVYLYIIYVKIPGSIDNYSGTVSVVK